MKLSSIEAMLVRAKVARKLVDSHQLDGYAALRIVVAPTPDALEASLSVARETGPSPLALWLAERPVDKAALREQRTISLDDLLLSL